jgi:hypothetical protein
MMGVVEGERSGIVVWAERLRLRAYVVIVSNWGNCNAVLVFDWQKCRFNGRYSDSFFMIPPANDYVRTAYVGIEG